MFRNLIPALADRYHAVAPDLPGFGFSDAPNCQSFRYTFEEGLSQGWNPIQKYWKEPTAENRAALREFLTPEATRSQYFYGICESWR